MAPVEAWAVFRETQAYYDAIYSFKDYAKEAREVEALVDRAARVKARNLLDVACGTGAHLRYLRRRFACEGLDLDRGMLRVARKRLKGVRLHRADMRSFDLGKQFDAVVCLFGSIGYVRTRAGLDRALAAFARHTRAGGVVIVEPWVLLEEFGEGRAGVLVGEAGGVKVARASTSAKRGRISTLEFDYLVAAGGRVTRTREVHVLGLFTRAEYERAFRRAGLSVRFRRRGLSGRGIFVGVKPVPGRPRA